VNPLADFTESVQGWSEIIAGRPEGGSHFRTGAGGVAMAGLAFVIAVLLSVAAQSAVAGMPGLGQVVFGLIAEAVTVALLGFVIARTLRWLNIDANANQLFVPTIYALAYAFVLAIPLALIGSFAGLIAVIGVALLIFRAAQVVAGMRAGLAAGLALLCFMVLVVVPNALYMLLSLVPPTA
jgi:hypothetical protein